MPVPSIWPIGSLINMQYLKAGGTWKNSIKGDAFSEMRGRLIRQVSIVFAGLCFWLCTGNREDYAKLEVDWVVRVVAKNILLVWLTCGPWHWLLYSPNSPYHSSMKQRKFNPDYRVGDWSRDVILTNLAAVIGGCFEVATLHGWATGRVAWYPSFFAHPLWSVGWMMFVFFWRDFHFFFVHRVMHPWFGRSKFDIGNLMYKNVHYLHHKSINVGPWSGIAMHPVESSLLFSCVVFPSFFFAQHPMHFYYNLLHVYLASMLGHDGFDQPAGGSFFHYLHHAHFECNYGTPAVPLDWLFGTAQDGSKFGKLAPGEKCK